LEEINVGSMCRLSVGFYSWPIIFSARDFCF
jgi:hypothetical protein